MHPERIARRLALLEVLDLPHADLESIAREFEDFDRALEELARFAEAIEFPSMQMQPDWPGLD